MLKKLKNQSLGKLLILLWNVCRMGLLRLAHPKAAQVSLIQNIHPSTVIAIDKGAVKFKHSIFTRKGVSLRVSHGGKLSLGTCFFNQGCSVTCLKNITIGDDCLFGPNVVIVDHDHDYRHSNTKRGSDYICKEVVIGNNVVVGANCVILKGAVIGDNCMIGAGSVVTGEIPEGTLYYVDQTKCHKQIAFYE